VATAAGGAHALSTVMAVWWAYRQRLRLRAVNCSEHQRGAVVFRSWAGHSDRAS
jgi:hypothetical protein